MFEHSIGNVILHLFFRKGGALLNPLEATYLLGLIPLELICEFVYPLTVWQKTFPFLPLMLTSVYCALGVTYAFIRLYISLLTCSDSTKKIKTQWILLFMCWRLLISDELDRNIFTGPKWMICSRDLGICLGMVCGIWVSWFSVVHFFK